MKLSALCCQAFSTSAVRGWRIDGVDLPTDIEGYGDCRAIREESELREAMCTFLQRRRSVHSQLLSQLLSLRDTLERSEWFFSHEVRSGERRSTSLQVYTSRGVPSWHVLQMCRWQQERKC